MYKRLLGTLSLILGFYILTEAQIYKYWITFKDKTNSPYSISAPQQFLTQKALFRRQKQGILIDSKDIPVNSWYIDTIINRGFEVLHASRWFNSVAIKTNDTIAVQNLLSIPFVEKITLLYNSVNNKKKKKKGRKEGDILEELDFNSLIKERKANTTNNVLNYGYANRQIEMLKGETLHNQGYQGQGMVIAVLDAGFWKVDSTAAFDSLWLNNQILGVKDFVEPNGNVFQKSTHGQMVLSVIGANVPGVMIGTAPKASFWLLRCEDASSEFPIEEANWAVAAEFADSVGVDVINSSLGYTLFEDTIFGHKYSEMDGKTTIGSRAATIASSRGILVVNSAGNSAQQSWKYIGTPADADSILTVGAVDSSKKYAPFSSVGPTADGRIKPDVSAMGLGTYVTTDNGIIPGNGTSFSSPVIAGMVTCLWQANPTFTNMQIIDAVKRSSSQYTTPDSLLGYGIPDFNLANIILSNGNKYIIENQHLSVLPNPFTEYLQIIFSSISSQKASIDLYNYSGIKIWEQTNVAVNPGTNNFYIGYLNSLSRGIYILVFKTESRVFYQKIIKL